VSRRKPPRSPLAQEERVVSRLRELEQEREPFRELTRRLVHAAFERFPVPAAGPIVEVGAGLGELYALLPDAVRARWVLTEPTELGARQLARRFPELRVEQATVEELPFADGEVAAVVGLCVLDLVSDLSRARGELERVLADGGLLLHFLDQNPHLASIFERLVPHGLVVLPNVFADPSAAHFPEDLCVVQAAQFGELVQLLRRHQQPVAEPLSRYLGLFTEKPWQLARALAEFDYLASDNERRTRLRRAFDAAPQIATPEERARLGDLRAQLVSSSQDLTGRLGRELASPTLQVRYNNLTFAGELVAAAPSAAAYRSLSVGQHRTLACTPEPTLVQPTAHPRDGQQLRELGLHVFAATRTSR
jgi:SAM-dependent methyltransferase